MQTVTRAESLNVALRTVKSSVVGKGEPLRRWSQRQVASLTTTQKTLPRTLFQPNAHQLDCAMNDFMGQCGVYKYSANYQSSELQRERARLDKLQPRTPPSAESRSERTRTL